MIKEIQEIINKSEPVEKKLKLLKKYKETVEREVAAAEEKIKEGYEYCPDCHYWYKKDTYTLQICEEKYTYYYFNDEEYEYPEERIGEFYYLICPRGHRCSIRYQQYIDLLNSGVKVEIKKYGNK